uniref:Aquaporin-8-like n=1 Tax=Crassostrea virginica TaxID=6565 RepID=A0A8B8CBZ3_CRAVI|nr:aquaporin-8-like [Crassostrea virginica]
MGRYVRPSLAEFVGTCLYVFVVCLLPMRVDTTAITVSGLLQGAAYVSLLMGPGKISGGYFNPVITASLALCGDLSVRLAVSLFAAQILGGMAGAALALAILPPNMYVSNLGGSTTLLNETEAGWGLFAEGILTVLVVLTVLMTTLDEHDEHHLSPFAVGFSILVGVTAGASLTGGSMNPARSLGPAVCYSSRHSDSQVWRYHYIYWVGPTAGALVASILFRFLFASGSRKQYRPHL